METILNIEIKESDKDRHYWSSKRKLSSETKRLFSNADVLILPWEERADGKDAYPTGTAELINILSQSTDDINFALIVNKDDYLELSLHSKTKRWPKMLVTTISLGVLSSLLASQIEHLLTSDPDTTKIEMGLIIQNQGGKCIEFNYTGPPAEFVDKLLESANRCFPEEVKINSASYYQNRLESSHKHK